jgi:hypothetical protein
MCRLQIGLYFEMLAMQKAPEKHYKLLRNKNKGQGKFSPLFLIFWLTKPVDILEVSQHK